MIKKRSLFLILIVGFILLITGCASVIADNPYRNTTPKLDPETGKAYNFKGMNIVIADWYGVYPPPSTVPTTSEKYWHEWTNYAYKLNIENKQMFGALGNPSIVANYCVEGDDDFYPENTKDEDKISYVFMIDERLALTGINNGLFYDLNDIKYNQFKKEPIFESNIPVLFTKGRSSYGFKKKEFYHVPGVYFNKRILQKNGYNPDDLYEWQKNGTWTWDVFEKMCRQLTQDIDYDGEIEVYAMCSNSIDFAYLCLYSNGGSIIKRNNRGNFINNAASEQSMEAWYWMSKIWKNYQLPQNDKPDNYYYSAFRDGEVAFFVGRQSEIIKNGNISKMFDDYGFVAFPKGPSGDGKYKSFYDASRYTVIPACYSKERVEKIVKALNLYYEPVPSHSNSNRQTYYPYYREERSVNETIKILTQNTNPLYEKIITGIDPSDMINKIIKGNMDPEEAYIKYQKGWDVVLKEANKRSKYAVYKDANEDEIEDANKKLGLFARLRLKRASRPKYSQLTAEEREGMSVRKLKRMQKQEENEIKREEKKALREEKRTEKAAEKELKKQEKLRLKEEKKAKKALD